MRDTPLGFLLRLRRYGYSLVVVFRLVFNLPQTQWFAAGLFLLLFVAHLIILPAHTLGTDIGLRSFKHATPQIITFAFFLSILESILISMWHYLVKHNTRCTTVSAGGGISIGIISPLLCCTPILPTILSTIAVLFPSVISGVGIKIQYAVNVYQAELLMFAIGLLLFSTAQNARVIAQSRMENC